MRLDGPTSAKLAAISKRGLHQQVLTNRTFGKQGTASTSAHQKENIPLPNAMETDMKISERPHVIKKSKSTNTLRLPPREETKKPGYCENCRSKFEDYSKHVRSGRHQRFARDPVHFIELDEVLYRVIRKTVEETRAEMECLPTSDSECDTETETETEDEEMESDDDTLNCDDNHPTGELWSDNSDTANNSNEGCRSRDEADDEDELALKGMFHNHSEWTGRVSVSGRLPDFDDM